MTAKESGRDDIRAAIDGLKITVLRAIPRNDWCLSLGHLSADTDIPREICRGILAELRADGLATYRKGLLTDDGEVAGAGYTLTPKGEALIDHACRTAPASWPSTLGRETALPAIDETTGGLIRREGDA